ncbi:unnamed protein product, partial [Phaeothamnion confervicola]
GFDPIATALLSLSAGQQAGALDQLTPTIFGQTAANTVYAGQSFFDNLLSCKVNGGDGAAIIREGQCVWARGRTRFLDVDASSQNPGLKERTDSFSAGAQVAVAPAWRVGFALGYDHSSIQANPNARSDGDRFNLGGVVKYNSGSLLLAAAVAGGKGSFDTTRTMSFGGFSANAKSNSDVDYLAGRLHASYLMDFGSWYLKPLVDGGPTRIYRGGFTESGGGGAGLIVQSATDTVWSISPGVEVGSQLKFGGDYTWRPFVRAGATLIKPADMAVTANFSSAPSGISPFTVNTKFDHVLADAGAGVDVINSAGVGLRVQYEGRFGEDTRQHSFSLKGSIPF